MKLICLSVFMLLMPLVTANVTAAEMHDMDSLLFKLDAIIANRDAYRNNRLKEFEVLHQEIEKADNPEMRFHAMGHLLDQYKSFNSDSSIAICERRYALASALRDSTLIKHARLSMADVYTCVGMFREAGEIVETMPLEEVPDYLINYYFHIKRTLYGLLRDYAITQKDKDYYRRLTDINRDSILVRLNPDDIIYSVVESDKLNSQGRYQEAIDCILQALKDKDIDIHNHAIAAYTVAESYRGLGDVDREKRYLILSSIADMQSGIKEYISLRNLAVILYQEGDIARAHKYLELCIEDAKEANARLRMIEISDVFPIVNDVYISTIDAQQSKLKFGIVCLCLLVTLLLAVAYYIYKEMQKVKRAREEVAEANDKLKIANSDLETLNGKLIEANRKIAENAYLKEVYIARYMDQCTMYIERLNKYRIKLNNIARNGHADDIKEFNKSLSMLENEAKLFYEEFDKTFISMFPTFISDFNNLLRPEERFDMTGKKGLNTELRIFALIRLGIDDSAKIARFLHYSLSTVYNYRTRIRNKAVGDRDQLEAEVMKIGKFTFLNDKDAL